MERNEPPFAGIAFGGGTARGMAHVGALRALDAAGRRPGAFAGSSFGAIVAALGASGLPVREIERIVTGQDLRELWAQALDFGLHRAALVHGGRLSRWLDRVVFGGARIEELPHPLAIGATDLASGAPVVLRAGPVAEAVRASCALPGIFAAVPHEGRLLVDGGFVEPVPFGALADLVAGPILGVHAGLDLHGSRALARLRALDASRAGRLLHRAAATDRPTLLTGLSLALRSYRRPLRAPPGTALVTVDPGIAWWDFHRARAAIDAGEAAVRAWMLSGAAPAAPAVTPGFGAVPAGPAGAEEGRA